MKNELLKLEASVMKKLLNGDLPFLVELRKQLIDCEIKERKFTGFGFYTTLAVSPNIRRTQGLDVKFGDVIADIPELPSGCGFLLYIKDGVLDMLEGYSYGETWPSSISEFYLKYTNDKERDLAAIEKALCRMQ